LSFKCFSITFARRKTPSGISPFAALSVTYIIGAIFLNSIEFPAEPRRKIYCRSIEISTGAVFVLGLAIVGLEAGSIYMYKAGWNVSSGQLVLQHYSGDVF
jgi:hypothetical protein